MTRAGRMILVFALLQGLYSAASHAESCADSGLAPSEVASDYSQVFVGTVRRTSSGCGDIDQVKMDVESGIAGVKSGERVTVKTWGASSGGSDLSEGERWLIFANDWQADLGFCGRSQRDPSASQVQDVVDALK